MSDVIHVKRPDIESAVWATPIPLVVIERCKPRNSLVMTWWALRWLMLVFPDRDGFGRREIGRRANVSEGRAHSYLHELAERELVEPVGEVEIVNLNPRTVWTIDLLKLHQLSMALVIPVITSWGAKPRPRKQPPEQAAFLFTPDDGSGIVGFQESGIVRFQEPEISGIVGFQESGIVRFHLKKGREEKGDDISSLSLSIAPPLEVENDSVESVPLAPDGERPLLLHPRQLWRAFAPAYDSIDDLVLADYAAEHDAPTGGYGWYWVGRAILALREAGRPMQLTRVRGLLRRWQARNAYGSDAPTYRGVQAEQPAAPALEPTPPPAPELQRIWGVVQDRLAARVPRDDYETWLKYTALLALDSERAVIGAPSIFAHDQLDATYQPAIAAAVQQQLGGAYDLVFVVYQEV